MLRIVPSVVFARSVAKDYTPKQGSIIARSVMILLDHQENITKQSKRSQNENRPD